MGNGTLYIKLLKISKILVGKPLDETTEQELREMIETSMQELWLDFYTLNVFYNENFSRSSRQTRRMAKARNVEQDAFQEFVESIRNEPPTLEEYLNRHTVAKIQEESSLLCQYMQDQTNADLKLQLVDDSFEREHEVNELNAKYVELDDLLSTPSPRLTWEAAQNWDRDRQRVVSKYWERVVYGFTYRFGWGWRSLEHAWWLLLYARYFYLKRQSLRKIQLRDTPYGSTDPNLPAWMNAAANDLFHIGNAFCNNGLENATRAINLAINFEATPESNAKRQDIERRMEFMRKYPFLWGVVNVYNMDINYLEQLNEQELRRWAMGLKKRYFDKPQMFNKKPLVNPRSINIQTIEPCSLNY